MKSAVGPIRDAADDSSSEEEEEEEDEEVEAEEDEGEAEKKGKKKSSLVRAFNKIASPLKSLGKRSTTELSPKSIQDRDAEASQRARRRRSPSQASVEASFIMPPPSAISGISGSSQDPFYVRRLESDLRESKEDLFILTRRLRESQEDFGTLLRRQESRESMLKEEIEMLRARLGEGSSGVRGGAGSSSGRRGGGGSSSGRY